MMDSLLWPKRPGVGEANERHLLAKAMALLPSQLNFAVDSAFVSKTIEIADIISTVNHRNEGRHLCNLFTLISSNNSVFNNFQQKLSSEKMKQEEIAAQKLLIKKLLTKKLLTKKLLTKKLLTKKLLTKKLLTKKLLTKKLLTK